MATTLNVVTPGNLDTEFDLSGAKISLKLDSTLWQDAATGAIGIAKVTAVKKTNQSVSNTTMTNDTALSLALPSGWWWVDVFLKYSSGARNDIKFDFTNTGTMSGTWQISGADNGTGGNSTAANVQLTAYSIGNVFVAGGNGAITNVAILQGVIQVTAAGVLQLRFANNAIVAGQALASMLAGSILKAEFLSS